MAKKKPKKSDAASIEVEVQTKHYRPLSSQWLANGVVTVDGKPVYWQAERQYAKWEIEPSAYEGWDVRGNIRKEAVSMIVKALQENRKFLRRLDIEEEKEEEPGEDDPRITLAHGGGGVLMQELMRDVIARHLIGPGPGKLENTAVVAKQAQRLVFTTSTFVVKPLFFRGGDIGRLAVCGTVNNLLTSCAKPVVISVGLVLEEGLPIATLEAILASMKKAADEARVRIVAGDVRVVGKGEVDKIFINTTGLGTALPRKRIGLDRAKPGDMVIISGALGNHGITIVCEREDLEFKKRPESDVAPLSSLVERLVKANVPIHCMIDPTRGGVAAALNRIARRSGVQISLDETAVPVHADVADICEMLGLDPLYVANQGKLIIVCSKRAAMKALEVMKRDPLGAEAEIIGQVTEGEPSRVTLERYTGPLQIVDMPHGDQFPRVF